MSLHFICTRPRLNLLAVFSALATSLVCLAGVLATGFLLPVFWAYRSTRSTPAHDHPDPDR